MGTNLVSQLDPVIPCLASLKLELQVAAHPPDVYKAIGDPNSVLTLVPQVLYPLNHLPSPAGWLSPTVEPTVSLKRSENLGISTYLP